MAFWQFADQHIVALCVTIVALAVIAGITACEFAANRNNDSPKG